MRLLLIEDDPVLCRELEQQLRQQGFAVDSTHKGVDGAFMGETEPYDIIILDLGLPDLPGLNILKRWRSKPLTTPVLVLTARGAWHEKVEGFRSGADDYLTKPFHFEELLVRLQALIRRASGLSSASVVVGDLELNEETQTVSWISDRQQGENMELTGVEFRLLRYMMLHPKHVFSASQLVEHVYDYNDEKESNVIEVYISRLRKKFGKDVICTRRGQGYFLNPDALTQAVDDA
ncbi:MAG: DNA-binding response regulator [Zetaproteobacteria bacterium CG_4_9_14_3_um_filter_49_83]|nr:MAG: DNA-binding response regulator [Zetaproteobacteria bacterium CG1_02_49_23]PIQ31914.1 MAG: DNA-binding response regulator [Zetaproteobacteria bacterium CG17_big_fil_post_rev_8_21_14_2_50_50_13]PIY56191.1 MAG: DNA-binding response regulator [Zetaproteobacteria bacterium CG_4_10_14_0_8_um_filter_49_80]PJA33978.1 MAG: DNA-binding response regulator [Zetaproteobacteria bacterium CG_4_9_14_3_um_filter_49_83]